MGAFVWAAASDYINLCSGELCAETSQADSAFVGNVWSVGMEHGEKHRVEQCRNDERNSDSCDVMPNNAPSIHS
jgi:hypothetical protein